MNQIKILLFCLILTLLSSCAHHKDVRPGGSDGEHVVAIKADSQEQGIREAVSQATHYCKQFNKIPKITSEAKKYQGDMDESVFKHTKKIKDAASILMGGTIEGQQAGVAADKYLGNPYMTEVKFKCE